MPEITYKFVAGKHERKRPLGWSGHVYMAEKYCKGHRNVPQSVATYMRNITSLI
jgi:hypothetical protein